MKFILIHQKTTLPGHPKRIERIRDKFTKICIMLGYPFDHKSLFGLTKSDSGTNKCSNRISNLIAQINYFDIYHLTIARYQELISIQRMLISSNQNLFSEPFPIKNAYYIVWINQSQNFNRHQSFFGFAQSIDLIFARLNIFLSSFAFFPFRTQCMY